MSFNFFYPVYLIWGHVVLKSVLAYNNQFLILTDYVHGCIECFQFGATSQEVWRNVLHAVLAHIKQLDLRQTKRCAKLSYAVTENENAIRHTVWLHNTDITLACIY